LISTFDDLKLYESVYQTITNFVNMTDSTYEWDDFTGDRFEDPFLESIRLQCLDAEVILYPQLGKSIRHKIPISSRTDQGNEIFKGLAAKVKEEIDKFNNGSLSNEGK